MSQERKEQVFLSYAHEDLKTIRKVYEGLTKRGLNVWFDKKNKRVGPWKPRILKAISRSRYFVFCLSEAALRKTGDEPGFQDEELDYAYDIAIKQSVTQFTIVPLRLEDCSRGDNRLSTFQQYDLFNNFEGCLDELAVEFGGRSLSNSTAKDERPETQKIIDALFGKAVIAYYANDYNQVLAITEAVIAITPDHALAWHNKGLVLKKLHRFNEAITAYDKAIKIKPDYAFAWWGKGSALYNINRFDEAIAASKQAININPDYAEVWCNKGAALYKLNKFDEAISAFDKSIEIDSNYASAWYGKGIALKALCRFDEAWLAVTKAYELNAPTCARQKNN